jgi:uncharacterized protein
MSDAKSPTAPSMDEILASIHRIIAEGEQREATARVEDDVLELTEAIGEDGSARHLAPFAAPAAAPDPAPPKTDDRSFDDIVRAELRPLVRAWLDEHLPGIVERLVAAEIARIAGRSDPGGSV